MNALEQTSAHNDREEQHKDELSWKEGLLTARWILQGWVSFDVEQGERKALWILIH